MPPASWITTTPGHGPVPWGLATYAGSPPRADGIITSDMGVIGGLLGGDQFE